MNDLKFLINSCVTYYINIAKTKYPNLSSFAIVTDEGFECFDIAVNTDGLLHDTCDEEYWNTAEWTEELLSSKYPNPKIQELYDLLNETTDKTQFLPICMHALKSIRNSVTDDVCLFVHVTDFGTSEELTNIVNNLNSPEILEAYQAYYAGSG